MEILDIRQLIGEATEYDKKQALEVKKPKSWCKSVSAFANGIGGKLVWGIPTPSSFALSEPSTQPRSLASKRKWKISSSHSKTN